MNPNNIQSGYWVANENRFIAPYDTLEEAQSHINFQKKRFGRDGLVIYKVSIQIKLC